MSSKNLLKILFLEDLPSDAELAIMQLMKEGLTFEHLRVETKAEFINALKNFRPDIVISDYMLPTYNGLHALLDKIEIDPLLPFILYTGSINEEIAVQCMKAGATDYIIKEHMTRLPFAVKEALEQALIQKEKRAADLLLSESEEKMQSIFRAAPVGIGLSIENIIIEVNDTFCKMTGYNRKELIGNQSEMLYASNEVSRNAAIEKYRKIDEIGTGSVETLLKCKDGSIINILICSTPLDKKDLSKGYTFTILDITARKKAEIALSESEDRFRNLYNEAVVGLYRTNSKGQIMLANRFLVKMLGFASFEELASINLNNTGVGTTYQRQKFIDQIEKEGEVVGLEAIWICRDGKEIFVRESAKAIRDSDGKIIYYDGTVEDITERKRSQES
jgi:PAS domain S-box-containing protein